MLRTEKQTEKKPHRQGSAAPSFPNTFANTIVGGSLDNVKTFPEAPTSPIFQFWGSSLKSMPKSFLKVVRVSEGQRKSHAISAAISTEPLFFFPDGLYSRPAQGVKLAADQTEPPPCCFLALSTKNKSISPPKVSEISC